MNTNYSIDKYDDKNMSFEEWAEDFRSLAIITQCPDDKAKHLIRLFLNEAGKLALKKLTQEETAMIDSLITALKRELAPTFLQDEAQDSLEQVRRGNQTIEHYGRLIAKTVSLAYPSLNIDDADKMSKKCFIRGLDSELRRRVEISNPINFQETISNALHQEHYLTAQKKEKRNKNAKQELTKLYSDFKDLQGIKRNKNSLTTAQNWNKRCQLCQSSGHKALKCKQSPVAVPAGKVGPKLTNQSPVAPTLANLSTNETANFKNLNVPKYIVVEVTIAGLPCHMLVDSGATRTILGNRWIKKFGDQLPRPTSTNGLQMVSASQNLIKIPLKLSNVELILANASITSDVLIMDNIPNNCDGILGLDILSASLAQIDFRKQCIITQKGSKEYTTPQYQPCKIENKNKKVLPEKPILKNENSPNQNLTKKVTFTEESPSSPSEKHKHFKKIPDNFCIVKEGLAIPGYSQAIVTVNLPQNYAADILLEGLKMPEEPFLQFGRSLADGTKTEAYLPCMNLSPEPAYIEQDKVVGVIDVIDYADGPDIICHPKESEKPKFNLEHLTNEEKGKMLKLLNKNLDIFSKNRTDLGRTQLCEHEINIEDSAPIRQYPRRKSPEARRLKNELIEQMLESDVIRPSVSPWASPILLTKKADGSTRFCIDFRKVNAVTKKDSYPISNITESLESLKDAKWFTIMDLQSGFWQVPIKEEHKEITAFTTGRKLYEFQVLPFGMTNSPATFSRLMEHVLQDLQWEICLIYIDDILVYARTYDELLERTQLIFNRLRHANLKLKPAKCSFGIKEVRYLGFKVSEAGIAVDSEKIQAVLNIPPPKTLKEIRSFLGMASYYRKFIKDFAKIAYPITKLTHQDTAIEWTEECDQAFKMLKQKLTTAPVLSYPNYDQQFILSTDASAVGLGAVLSQLGEDGKEHPVAYASRTLNAAEKNYSTTKRECLALIWAVQYFHPYLYNQKEFLIITDG